MRVNDRLVSLLALVVLQAMVWGPDANAQETHLAQSEALLRWADSVLPGELPAGTPLPPADSATIARVVAILASPPGAGTRPGTGGAVPPSGEGQNPSRPPITIQLPPHPPQAQAPSVPGQPPMPMPDPSSIPTPPARQAPPSQGRPPIAIPGASAGGAPSTPARPPILDPLTIPLPPTPPEEQAPR